MRVAILIPGLTRNYEQTYLDMQKYLIDPNRHHEIDTYLCCWDKTFPKNGWDNPTSYTLKDVLKMYQPFQYCKLYLEKYQYIAEEITHCLLSKNKLPQQGKNFVTNAICYQFIAWNECFKMIEKNGPYDLVIKSRFDLIFSSEIAFSSLLRDNLLICSGDHKKFLQHGFCDMLFAGTSEQVKAIMSAIERIHTYRSEDNLFPEVIIRNLLSGHMSYEFAEFGIKLRR